MNETANGEKRSETASPRLRSAVARARAAGVSATWTGDCSATVELSRLRGPRHGAAAPADPRSGPVHDEAMPATTAELYRWALTDGTQFDIYRWVNLYDLARMWADLDLPAGIRHQWELVLRSAGLVRDRVDDR